MPGSNMQHNAHGHSSATSVAASPRSVRPQPNVRHVEAAVGEHQVIMAERFKTKLCRTFQQTDACPYEFKCMFAHGQDELRCQADNERDGLTSEEAVKQWQRVAKSASLEAAAAASTTPSAAVATATAATSNKASPLPEGASLASPMLPQPRSRQQHHGASSPSPMMLMSSLSGLRTVCPKVHMATDVHVKEDEYRNLTPVCAAWVSALLTPASPSAYHHHHDVFGIAHGAADDFFQANGGLIG